MEFLKKNNELAQSLFCRGIIYFFMALTFIFLFACSYWFLYFNYEMYGPGLAWKNGHGSPLGLILFFGMLISFIISIILLEKRNDHRKSIRERQEKH